MTLKDFRAIAKLVTDWCLAQDDLRGFGVVIQDYPRGVFRVTLDWSDDWHDSQMFSRHEIRDTYSCSHLVELLDATAHRARARAARLRDPNRLPG